MTSNRLAQRVLEPDELEMVQGVFDRITSQPWFSREPSHRTEFARYVLNMYFRGLVMPWKLEGFCTVAARKRYAISRSGLEGRRILVVEDDYYEAQETATALTELGAQVVGPISNLSAAMDVAARDMRLDGALLDINLDG
jgi:hypothetical protein